MLKKLILFVFVILCFSCKTDSNNGFKGKWVNTENEKKIIVISKIGENYTININDREKYSAIENNGILKIIVENDSINAKIDSNKFLVIENEKFKKLNGRYTNPGAGIY
ncbi:hypothetical protein [Ulvibacter antarcticus]|uniref:Uncharacterized protein n=1 Tax=Ulvibacter antarcticus TaxID=442714 RepID=A0A3L9ZBK1_9FLAO|nr:hypothetical protein [Ulvibacter antarcticus]RMA67685.1 hypothetical protein BXY75_0038 [Ulvibacter antarcticus]